MMESRYHITIDYEGIRDGWRREFKHGRKICSFAQLTRQTVIVTIGNKSKNDRSMTVLKL